MTEPRNTMSTELTRKLEEAVDAAWKILRYSRGNVRAKNKVVSVLHKAVIEAIYGEPTELTKEKLSEIRERADIAPLGPWVTDTLYRHSRTEVCLALLDAGGIRLADTLNADEQTINEDVDEDSISFYVSGACADALEFAAHARTDIPDLLAHIHTLEEQNGRLREALVKAEADMVTADATANGRWSEWGDRATWVADKLDEAIEGVRAALAPPVPATREMEP